jgi:glycosyltransferase involved in cell wall biosynthesis
MRLAWFSPWPPQRGDAASRSAVVVPALAERGFGIDVFVDERRVSVARVESTEPPAAGEVRILGAHDFVWRTARSPYDLTVFHVADSALHDFVWAYLFQWPGLTVLHDGRVHQARSRALLAQHRHGDYRAEFAWNHPDVSPAAAELAVNGYEGPFSCQWPMIRTVVTASRLVATHARGALAELETAGAGRPVDCITAGDGGSARALADDAHMRARVRIALGLPSSAIVFGVFDALGPEWRVPQILRAFAGARARTADARLLLAGPRDPDLDVAALVHALGLDDEVRLFDRPDALDELGVTIDEAIAATDVTLALRWPAALDVSSTWLAALAAGRATVILDLVHLAEVPAIDPRTWRRHAPADQSSDADAEAAAIGVDVMDEDHSLRLALQHLAIDAALRARLGRSARAYWQAHHSPARMVEDYARAIARAATLPVPEVVLPSHLRPDPLAHARALVAPIGEPAVSIVASLSGPRG